MADAGQEDLEKDKYLIERYWNPFEGIGKPEPLRGELGGLWSRRIDEKNRLIYCISDDSLQIFSCRGHYE